MSNTQRGHTIYYSVQAIIKVHGAFPQMSNRRDEKVQVVSDKDVCALRSKSLILFVTLQEINIENTNISLIPSRDYCCSI